MENLKLLIVDDVEDNRLVLRAICRKLDGFEIFEAVDGQDAVEKCEELRPHIILMDIMMPRLDGFQAAKIIKDRYPDTIIMAVTAVIDPKMEANMAQIGVAAYIRKPIDKDLLRIKLQSYAGVLSVGGDEKKMFSNNIVLNPFSEDIRSFKTIFSIHSVEAIMDFGIWILARFECAHATVCTNIDMIIELIYELVNQELKNKITVTITIEESFEEVFIHASLPKKVVRTAAMEHLICGLGSACLITEPMVAFRISIIANDGENKGCALASPVPNVCEITTADQEPVISKKQVVVPEIKVEVPEKSVELRTVGAAEHQVLRESFAEKMNAKDYVDSIDSDAFGEVSDLREADLEWSSWLHTLTDEPTEENFRHFANEVLGAYSNAISALYEFSGLAYAIISLSTLIKANTGILICDEVKRAKILEFLGYFKNDLSSWIEHVFELQDTQDIHYLDGSFFSSCMQIESIITGTEVDLGDEGEIEFF
ncbi:MAG: response regulator [Sulfuricurvum sp.]|nr:response regulator [Sulfuricurvum sp.]